MARLFSSSSPLRERQAQTAFAAALTILVVAAPGAAHSQAPSAADPQWQACTATASPQARLACFDGWAQRQRLEVAPPGVDAAAPPAVGAAAPLPPTAAPSTGGDSRPAAGKGTPSTPIPLPANARATGAVAVGEPASGDGCRDGAYTPLSRFWELERATDCGSYELRGYKPISLSITASDSVNDQPMSPAPGRSAVTAEDYRTTEARIQLSARIKVAKNLLTREGGSGSDSVWLGFSQQSYWQVFTSRQSRPFRTTDYEPEAMYMYPADVALPFGWRMRYLGLGLSHQSNGRTLPQSRSWNRGFLMTGLELDDRFALQVRLWKRSAESGNDDNPDIVGLVGRGELTGTWYADKANTFSATVRHSLRSDGNGSVRLEYFRAVGKGTRAGNLNDLRLHAQLFSGYGDSMLDYNRKRNVFSLGLALVDW